MLIIFTAGGRSTLLKTADRVFVGEHGGIPRTAPGRAAASCAGARARPREDVGVDGAAGVAGLCARAAAGTRDGAGGVRQGEKGSTQ